MVTTVRADPDGPEQKLETGAEADESLGSVDGASAEKTLIRKIDWHLLPPVWLLYLLAVRAPISFWLSFIFAN